ncbi:MAG: potassium channel family protein, partial [Pseudomonadota bacterium]
KESYKRLALQHGVIMESHHSDNGIYPKHHHRRRIIILILGLLLLHVIEVWIFGSAYYLLLHQEGFGEIVGAPGAKFVDCVYFSASVFTTVGFGDLHPIGPIRTMTGTEGIAGLTLITWSASYTFIEMLKRWDGSD